MRRYSPVLFSGLILLGTLAGEEFACAQDVASLNVPAANVRIDVLILGTNATLPEESLARLSGRASKVANVVEELNASETIRIEERLRLTGFADGESISVQSGKTVPMATGRTQYPQGGRGGRGVTTYQHQNVGTIATATVQTADGLFDIRLQIEKSDISVTEPSDADEFVPPSTTSLSSQLAVRLRDGETVLAGGYSSSTDSDSTTHLILVSAHIINPAQQQSLDRRRNIRIYRLQNVAAASASELISRLFKGTDRSLRIATDERTNSIIVVGRGPLLTEIEAILMRIDQKEAKQDTDEAVDAPEDAVEEASEAVKDIGEDVAE